MNTGPLVQRYGSFHPHNPIVTSLFNPGLEPVFSGQNLSPRNQGKNTKSGKKLKKLKRFVKTIQFFNFFPELEISLP